MHPEAYLQRDAANDTWVAFAWAVLLHAALLALLILAGWWKPVPKLVSVAGPVIEAALVVTEADVQRSEQALADAPKPEPAPAPPEPAVEKAAPPPQPEPEPTPQTSEIAPQPQPQAPQAEPDTKDQEKVVRLAEQKAKEEEEQEAKQRQEQIDLTEREKQQEAEKRQHLREQQLAQLKSLRDQRDAAAKATKLAEQKLQQLADRPPAAAKPAPKPAPPSAAPLSGNNGTDTDLQARYVLAMNQTARANWNTALAPEGIPCRVTFIQMRGGEVMDVRFPNCPFDAQGRDSVDRALRKTPMPYAGFEDVYAREVTLTLCYPEEVCKQ